MERRAARVWFGYQAGTWFAFQTSSTVAIVFLITRLELNPLQLTLVGTALELTVTLCEIPTGVVADTVSRKLSIIIGVVLLGAGFLLFAVPNYGVVLGAQVVWGVGYTFTSGADVAWITDEVGEAAARPLYVRGAQVRQVAIFCGIVVGGALGAVSLQLAMVVGALLQFAVAAWLALAMPETGFVRPAPEDRVSPSATVRRTVGDASRTVRAHPTLWLTLGVMALMGLSEEGFDRLWHLHVLNDIGIPSVGHLEPIVWIAALDATGLLCAAALTEIVRRHADLDSDRGVERAAELSVTGIVLATTAFAFTHSFWVAAAVICCVAAVWEVSEPVLAAWVNRGLDARTRATVNSLASQSHAIGEVAGGPLWGSIALWTSTPVALAGAGLCQLPSLLVLARRRRTTHPTGTVAADAPAAD